MNWTTSWTSIRVYNCINIVCNCRSSCIREVSTTPSVCSCTCNWCYCWNWSTCINICKFNSCRISSCYLIWCKSYKSNTIWSRHTCTYCNIRSQLTYTNCLWSTWICNSSTTVYSKISIAHIISWNRYR